MSVEDERARQSQVRRRGRPPRGVDVEALNVMVPTVLMERVRTLTTRRGQTIVAFVRQALEEKLEREETGKLGESEKPGESKE